MQPERIGVAAWIQAQGWLQGRASDAQDGKVEQATLLVTLLRCEWRVALPTHMAAWVHTAAGGVHMVAGWVHTVAGGVHTVAGYLQDLERGLQLGPVGPARGERVRIVHGHGQHHVRRRVLPAEKLGTAVARVDEEVRRREDVTVPGDDAARACAEDLPGASHERHDAHRRALGRRQVGKHAHTRRVGAG